MATVLRFHWLAVALTVVVLNGATRLWADSAGNGGSAVGGSGAVAPSGGVDLFDAMHDGDLGAQFIARDSREATLILTNNTDKPLSVRLPAAFAAIPVLAQGALLAPAAPGRTTGPGSKQPNQPLGSNTQNKRPGQRQGLFDIPPERIVKLKVPAVCLEFGYAEPNMHVRYVIEPIEQYTSDPELQEVCKLLGTDKIDQQVAQAAAWHLANHLSWEKLAEMKHFPHNSGFTRPVFTQDQIRAAMQLTDKAIKAADARLAEATPRSSGGG